MADIQPNRFYTHYDLWNAASTRVRGSSRPTRRPRLCT